MLTVMERPGATLVEFIRCYTDDAFRRELVANLKDPIVKRYWTDQIDRQDFHRSEVLDWIVSKFNRFVTDPTIRRIIGQSQSGFSFRAAMDTGKIVLLSLAKGRVGADNANFLGLVLLPRSCKPRSRMWTRPRQPATTSISTSSRITRPTRWRRC